MHFDAKSGSPTTCGEEVDADLIEIWQMYIQS